MPNLVNNLRSAMETTLPKYNTLPNMSTIWSVIGISYYRTIKVPSIFFCASISHSSPFAQIGCTWSRTKGPPSSGEKYKNNLGVWAKATAGFPQFQHLQPPGWLSKMDASWVSISPTKKAMPRSRGGIRQQRPEGTVACSTRGLSWPSINIS